MGLLAAGPARAAARLGEDGLYQHDWYLESFLDLGEFRDDVFCLVDKVFVLRLKTS